MNNTSDVHVDALLTGARDGDTKALDRLLDIYRNYLKLLARSQIGIQLRIKVDPSDLVQETLLDAYRDFARFRGETGQELITWLRKILAHNLTDQIKRHRAQRRDLRRETSLEASLDRSSEAIAGALNAASSSPSRQLTRQEQSVAVADALARLPDDYREVIFLRQIERNTFEQIAQRMERSSGAVRMLWARGLERLRHELESRE